MMKQRPRIDVLPEQERSDRQRELLGARTKLEELTLAVDHEATDALRATMRAARG